ncbi:hypothetical protein Tco_0783237 [Tanacetum coccineum]
MMMLILRGRIVQKGPSTSSNQEQDDEFDFWTDSYASNDDEIEERTSRWVNKRHKEPGRLKEEIYSNSKIVQVIKTFWELGHEHKFNIEIMEIRANDCIVSITEPDYKNLNKNDIEDMYLLIMNNKHVYGIIYTNIKKEKRVMRPSEIHKFCDATLRRTLEGLKSYYNDVKYGYVQKELTNDELEFLKLFEEEIEVRLKYRDQMRRWEMYVFLGNTTFVCHRYAELQAEEGEGSGNPSEPQPPPSTAQPTHEEPIPNIESSSPQKTQSPRQALNKDTEWRGDSVDRAANAATSLEAICGDSSNSAKTHSTANTY